MQFSYIEKCIMKKIILLFSLILITRISCDIKEKNLSLQSGAYTGIKLLRGQHAIEGDIPLYDFPNSDQIVLRRLVTIPEEHDAHAGTKYSYELIKVAQGSKLQDTDELAYVLDDKNRLVLRKK